MIVGLGVGVPFPLYTPGPIYRCHSAVGGVPSRIGGCISPFGRWRRATLGESYAQLRPPGVATYGQLGSGWVAVLLVGCRWTLADFQSVRGEGSPGRIFAASVLMASGPGFTHGRFGAEALCPPSPVGRTAAEAE